MFVSYPASSDACLVLILLSVFSLWLEASRLVATSQSTALSQSAVSVECFN